MIEFHGIIENAGGGGAFILFPFDTMALFGEKNLIPVIVTYDNKIEYRGRIANMGKGPMIPILKDIRIQLGKEFGDSVWVQVVLDTQERKIEIPMWLKSVFVQHSGTEATFKKWSYTQQKENIRFIEEAKREETKLKRMQALIDKLIAS